MHICTDIFVFMLKVSGNKPIFARQNKKPLWLKQKKNEIWCVALIVPTPPLCNGCKIR